MARGEYGIDLPGRSFGHDELTGPAERDAQATAGEPLNGVGPERLEEQGALEARSENVPIDGRIFPPAGFVAIELIGHDSVESERRVQFVFGLKFDQAAFQAREPMACDGEFAEQVLFEHVARGEPGLEIIMD